MSRRKSVCKMVKVKDGPLGGVAAARGEKGL